MNHRAATFEADGPQGGSNAVATVDPAAPRGGPLKFLYASGSRPLDGYTIKRGIGRGGFGEVYFAASDAGKEVALKHVERNLEVELRGVGQCLNLKHVNLVDLYDIRYDDQGEAWVVMEYVAGSSLKEVIDRNPNGLPREEVEAWFRGIAEGVAYLHDHGIVHRDLKPGNIFDGAGVVKIGDYGLSKFISCSRRSGQTESVGTFHYMAPEIGKGVYGKEIDIYALGIILFEMLTGHVPFEGESSQEIIMKHLTADPDLSGVPQPYRTVIARSLQKDPEKRYRSVAEMIAALAPGASHDVPSIGNVKPKFNLVVPPVRARAPQSSPLAPRAGHSGLAHGVSELRCEPIYIGDDERDMQFGPVTFNQPQPAGATPSGCCGTGKLFSAQRMITAAKIVVALAIAIGLASVNFRLFIVAAVASGLVALTYFGIRTLLGAMRKSRAADVPASLPHDAKDDSPAEHPKQAEQQGRMALRMKTLGDRAGELSGSMLAAAGIAAVLTIVMMVIGESRWLVNAPAEMAGPVWLWLTTTVGAWLILCAGKFWERSSAERHSVDQMKRRFVLLVLGLALGAIAFGTHRYLMVDSLSDQLVVRGIPRSSYPDALYDRAGAPRLPAYLAYFAAIFATLGWWKQTDPLRSSRLSIGSVIVVLLAAWLWQLVWPFPQPWGFLLVASISIAVQLSSPWLSRADRAAIRQQRRQLAMGG